MTITKKRVVFVLSLTVAAGSMILFGDTLRLIAEERIGELSGILMLNACVLAAIVFAYRAKDAREQWPLSIIKSGEGR